MAPQISNMAAAAPDKMAAAPEKMAPPEPSEYRRAMSVWHEYSSNCALLRAMDEYVAHSAMLPKEQLGNILRCVMQLRAQVRLLLSNKCFQQLELVHRARKKTPRECLMDFVQSKPQGGVMFECAEMPCDDTRQPAVYSATVDVKWCGFEASVKDIHAFTRNAALRSAARMMCENLGVPCH
jgi:hypothetical protein